MNISVVEDNKYEMNNIINVLKSISKEFNIYQASTGEECFKILEKTDIDLFILDIQLPDISGLKIAEKIRNISKYELTYIIFITTHIYFQLDAFKKVHCYDFLEKPYKKQELVEIIKRLSNGISKQKEQIKVNRQQISLQMKNCIVKIYTDEILFVESNKRDCTVHTKNKEFLVKNTTVKKMLELLPIEYFMQVHRSYIINLENIHEIGKYGKNSWAIYFKEYPLYAYVSNSYKNEFLDRFLG
ncbi:LytR/AlgR family response regulator transcription factor [Alkaliphilus flagellatus]|uniref:LytR/AlgR family response regulator transcription factor n=1 Tax=Alkaliphilus flagellatus TaxID=2841507 RepID=UPI001FEB958D|nr:LytTR family DNA-binding domain-containing protein [Alkaliphilus flagellatus]